MSVGKAVARVVMERTGGRGFDGRTRANSLGPCPMTWKPRATPLLDFLPSRPNEARLRPRWRGVNIVSEVRECTQRHLHHRGGARRMSPRDKPKPPILTSVLLVCGVRCSPPTPWDRPALERLLTQAAGTAASAMDGRCLGAARAARRGASASPGLR